MTQFMLVESDIRRRLPDGLRADPVAGTASGFLGDAAEHHFGTRNAYSVVSSEGSSAEPLIDDVWQALGDGAQIEATPFGRLVGMLIRDGIGFALWTANDYRDLPIVRSWPELAAQLRVQARVQPADLFVRFVPGMTTEP